MNNSFQRPYSFEYARQSEESDSMNDSYSPRVGGREVGIL